MKRLLGLMLLACASLAVQAQVITSPNLVPNPGHWTTGGQSINQAFAINQALALSGSPVRIQGFDWGYTYSLDAGGSVTSNTVITNSAGQTLHTHSSLQTDGPTYGLRGASYGWTMPTALPQTALGTFNYSLAAQGPAVVFDSYARARYTVDSTTGNVIYSTVNPAPEGISYGWSGFQIVNYGGGGLSGGNVPGYNVESGQFMFGYTNSTIAYRVALNTALSGTGIVLGGVKYGLQYFNQDYARGTLNATFSLKNSQGTTLESYSHDLPQTTEYWTSFDQYKVFANPHLLSNIGDATMSVTGRDDRFWAGHWGPQFRYPYMRFTYITDQCAANPLSSADCPGYAAAYLSQQCTISALFNASCPGYAAAYFTQQCTVSSLYDPACPGYAAAYKAQQCSINALYATDCPGYAVAYKTQQCSINALYATDCPGYAEAYLSQQCAITGLYSNQCPNYAEAYAKKNVLNIGSTTTTTTTAAVTESVTSTAKTDPVSIATTSTTTSTTSPTSVTSVTSVVSGGTTNAATAVVTSTPTQSTTTTTTSSTTTEAKKTDAEVKTATTSSSGSSGTASPKSRAEAVARQVAREASEAKTFEAQAATQGLQIGLMGFVPGFDAYGAARIIDVNGQQMARLYNRPTVDNRNALRGLTGASDRVHQNMVDQQYQLGK